MAGKRSASREINHENWDQDDEPEEPGTFQRASEEALRNRVIKTARRKQFKSPEASETTKSIFANFTDSLKREPSSKTSPFSFLSNLSKKPEETKVNGKDMFKASDFTASKNVEIDDGNQEYYAKLKGLNESVAKVIKEHVDKNPFINLQPIFRDYEKYIDELDKLKDNAKESEPEETVPKTESQTNYSSFVFKPTTTTSNIFNTDKTGSSTPKPLFSFGSSNQNFSFTSQNNTGFTFGSAVTKPDEDKQVENENEDDTPPKVEFTPVEEEGHVYKIRCKVFVKKDGNFVDKGVGNLFLKPIADSEKVQLIVRADTNLGNLLCNFILSESIPVQKMGSKDVMLVCLVTPDMKPPPVPTLFRVKTPEDAEDLYKTLLKYRK